MFGLLHDVLVHPSVEMIQPENVWKKNEAAHWVWEHLEPVSNLRSEGIKFSSCEHRSNILDIEFVKGVLIMHKLVIYDQTESLLKNVMAYEHYQIPYGKPRYVSDYVFFLNCLINTPEDVKWLRRCGIIESYIENDEEVCMMINRLARNILASSNFYYSKVFYDINRHCRHRTKKWFAQLWRDYFNRPWSILAALASFALFGFAAVQTTYAVNSYYRKP
ncbi:UNVERIFIED_CONTAM: hypothetical protein Scaly_1044100 [Sesamum calycinum]|uniref:Uncharacterized protein n=1 Tax=Sesamum calycinum TaxID=2727403 RepID=A0AAW2QLG2_9LAMI